MDILHIIVIAIVQGVTEFLPISSSAHLILISWFSDWHDQSLGIDIAAHLGSMLAVLFYFRADILAMVRTKQTDSQPFAIQFDRHLLKLLMISTVPVLIVGFLFHDIVADSLRKPIPIALASIIFGIWLWYADKTQLAVRKLADISLSDALFIGCVQVFSLMPGASRAGVTITAALLRGFEMRAALLYSFLLAIPVITVVSGYQIWQLTQRAADIKLWDFTCVAGLSAVSAYFTIHLFLNWAEKIGMLPFMIYRLLLGGILITIFAL